MEQKDPAVVRAHWDSTGLWRLTYFDELKVADPSTLPHSLRLERDFVIAEEQELLRFVRDGSAVLELGCGVGRSLFPMVDEFPDTAFVGIDFAVGQIALFRNEVRRRKLSNVAPVAGDVGRLPFRSGTFDKVLILNQTFGNFLGETRTSCLDEAWRVLTDDGALLIGGFTNIGLAQACYREWGVAVESIDLSTGLVELEPYRSLWAPETEVTKLLHAHGFRLAHRRLVPLGFVNVYGKT